VEERNPLVVHTRIGGQMRKPLAVVAALALLGLGISAAFLLPSSHASGSATYTYPTKPPPTKTTTHETTTHPEETTTEPAPATTEATTEAATTTTETTSTVSTTTTSATTTEAATTSTTPPTVARVTARVRVRSNSRLHATVLVDQAGMTLYHFTRERARRVLCTGACASVWPPLLVGAGTRPLAGLGINRLRLGTVRRPDGRLQVTYAGLALYRYSGDARPGDAKGQGFGKVWFAVRPSGRLIGA
jgi:predicted lipoprotein with Yx(FWY)xxD motif